ncbi:MAG TPA: LysR substrate-binding domain-containing protein [Trebonia sp.]
MSVGGVDLNLLVILQALLEEGNVTRAGARVGMPQPAMSTALARLRRHYKDELLLRAGNGYALTPLARSLLPAVRESARLTGHAFSPGDRRQPPPGGHVFTIGLSDYAAAVLAGPLLRRVRDLAPQVRIELHPVAASIPDDRQLLGCELVVAPAIPRPDLLQAEVIWRDRLVYVADPGNPRLRDGRLSLADLAAAPHAAARLPYGQFPGGVWGGRPPDGLCQPDPAAAALARHGITPDVVVTTDGWLTLPFLVAGTDLVAAVPERLARRVAATAGTTAIDPPFGPIELTETAWWHPMRGTDPALSWLRTTMHETAAFLSETCPSPA